MNLAVIVEKLNADETFKFSARRVNEDGKMAIQYLLDQIIFFYNCNRASLSKLSGENQGTIIVERCNMGYVQKFYPGQVVTFPGCMKWDRVYSPINLQRVFCEGEESEEQAWLRKEHIENLMVLAFEYGNGEIGNKI